MKKFLVIAGVVAGGVLMTGAPSLASEKAQSCAAYAYVGTSTTICDRFPGNQDRNCPALDGTVKLVVKGTDPWRLDRDKDGTGCEGDALKPVDAATDPKTPADDSGNQGGTASPVLPKTGADASTLVIAGGAVVGLGAFMMALRRRKIRFTA